jgi:hypothetical protein
LVQGGMAGWPDHRTFNDMIGKQLAGEARDLLLR